MSDSFGTYTLVMRAIKVINAAHLHAARHSRMQVRAVAKVPPIRERRRDLLHLLAQAEFSEDLHRPQIDKMRLGVGTGSFAALHKQRADAISAEQRRQHEPSRPAAHDCDVNEAAWHRSTGRIAPAVERAAAQAAGTRGSSC